MKMKFSLFKLSGSLLLLILLLNSAILNARDLPDKEVKVTIAYLYNFIRYVDWPSETFKSKDSDLTICHHKLQERYLDALSEIEGKKKDSHRIRTVKYSEKNDCQVLFTQSSLGEQTAVLNTLKDKNTLTISNIEGFAKHQGMIELTKSGKKIRFTVNKTAVIKSRLKVSSKLMRLATVVEDK